MAKFKKTISIALAAVMTLGMTCVAAGNDVLPAATDYQYEHLDRGLVGATVSGGIFLSWRFFQSEATGYSDTGLTGTDFNVYRNGECIATVTDSTNYLDPAGTAADTYFVRGVVKGIEVDESAAITPLSQNYLEVAVNKPANAVTPDGRTLSYSIGDMSIGDVDGDGVYEYFVKWEASPQDVIGKGYTGSVLIDCYKADGTVLWRMDLGKNIREGAHYTQFMVYDYDRDGKAEIMFKTAPGTSVVHFDSNGNIDESTRQYITMPSEDIEAGYSHEDDYRSNDGAPGVEPGTGTYYLYVLDLFMNWDQHPEVLNGNWPATLQECMAIPVEGQYASYWDFEYPLSEENARTLVDYFMDVYAPARSSRNALRDFQGYIFSGPEYLSVFNGETGYEMQTIAYPYGRDDDGLMWGDYAMVRIEPCNRVERFLGGVAYLDGENPNAVFARGYYTRTTIAAYSWDGANLSQTMAVDSGYPVMSNPFNDGPHGMDGRNPEYANITTQGFHSLTCADVDGDGYDEIVFGSATIDHDGSVLYSSFGTIPSGDAAGSYARMGHGDSIHVTDIDPDRPGLEIWTCHEGGAWAPYGQALRDAATGEVLFGDFRAADNGRAIVGDFDTSTRGLELFTHSSLPFYSADGSKTISTKVYPSTSQNIKWSADLTTQGLSDVNVQRWTPSGNVNIFSPSNVSTNNGTKANAALIADVFGDYREELILKTKDSSAFRIFFNADEISSHKLYTLMNDRQYRAEVARQNCTYNQPSYTSFYYASDMNFETLFESFCVHAESVQIDNPALTVLKKGQSLQLSAAVSPVDATMKDVVWKVANESIATIDANGVITGLKTGMTAVTVKTVDGNHTHSIVVRVTL